MIPRRKAYIFKGEFYRCIQFWLNNDKNFPQYITKWEDAFAHYIGTKFAIATSSGRFGMELILKSLELTPGDEVIIPAYTLKDLVGIIQSQGVRVIPADIDAETFNIDPDSILIRITKRTKVILATHLFGTPCQIDKILETAKRNSIFVIEDCAHSVGTEFRGCKTGSFGDVAFFSFETIKPINAYGGGMVVTNDEKLSVKIRRLQAVFNYKISKSIPIKKIMAAFLENLFLPTAFPFPFLYLFASASWNKKIYRLYRKVQKSTAAGQIYLNFQAFMGLEKLKTLDARISNRNRQANLFKSLLSIKIKPQQIGKEMLSNYYFFVALLPSHTWRVRKFLLQHGIDAGIGSEIADDCASILGSTDCPNTACVFQRALQLPLHEGLTEGHIRYVSEVLTEALG